MKQIYSYQIADLVKDGKTVYAMAWNAEKEEPEILNVNEMRYSAVLAMREDRDAFFFIEEEAKDE